MQEEQVFGIVLAAIITSGVTLSMIVHAWVGSRKHRVRAQPSPRLDAIEARLARMEDMIESVALEMERVAEGQRFTAKLLADRATSAAPPLPSRAVAQPEGRVNTPH